MESMFTQIKNCYQKMGGIHGDRLGQIKRQKNVGIMTSIKKNLQNKMDSMYFMYGTTKGLNLVRTNA